MQDRYAGDIGDYGKIALLKALQAQGMAVGVNWYKVETLDIEKKPDGLFKQEDGKYRISGELCQCDRGLVGKLLKIFESDDRSIDALEKFKPIDIVFVDSDNGMLVKSVGKKSVRSVKYTFYDEVRDYIEQKQSVLIYNHRCRKQESIYFHEICEKLEKSTGIPEEKILKITFPKCSVRDYLAVSASEDHTKKIRDAFLSVEQVIWGELGVCRIPGL